MKSAFDSIKLRWHSFIMLIEALLAFMTVPSNKEQGSIDLLGYFMQSAMLVIISAMHKLQSEIF